MAWNWINRWCRGDRIQTVHANSNDIGSRNMITQWSSGISVIYLSATRTELSSCPPDMVLQTIDTKQRIKSQRICTYFDYLLIRQTDGRESAQLPAASAKISTLSSTLLQPYLIGYHIDYDCKNTYPLKKLLRENHTALHVQQERVPRMQVGSAGLQSVQPPSVVAQACVQVPRLRDTHASRTLLRSNRNASPNHALFSHPTPIRVASWHHIYFRVEI